MEKVITTGKEYLQMLLDWLQEGLNTNSDIFVSVVIVGVAIFVILAFKEILDVLFGKNKGALKKKNRELEEQCSELNDRNVELSGKIFELESHANAMEEKLSLMKAIKFDEVFSDSLLKEIAEKQEVANQDNEEEDSQKEDSQKEDSDEGTSDETEKKVFKSGYFETI